MWEEPERCLSSSPQAELGCSKVLVTERLTRSTAQDVLRLSCTEPCGLRSCVTQQRLEEGSVSDASTEPDFELTLRFKQEPGSPGGFGDFFS